MQTNQSVKRGDKRVGAGRPKGSGRYGEATVSVRVPVGMMEKLGGVEELLCNAKKPRNLPLYLVK